MKTKEKKQEAAKKMTSKVATKQRLSGFVQGMNKYAGMVQIVDMRAVMR